MRGGSQLPSAESSCVRGDGTPYCTHHVPKLRLSGLGLLRRLPWLQQDLLVHAKVHLIIVTHVCREVCIDMPPIPDTLGMLSDGATPRVWTGCNVDDLPRSICACLPAPHHPVPHRHLRPVGLPPRRQGGTARTRCARFIV